MVNGFFSLSGQVYFWACRLVFIHVDVSYLINTGSVSLPQKNNIHKVLASCIGIPKFDGHCKRFPSHFIVDPLSEGGGGVY